MAHYQATKVEEWRDEQPGKIMHEIRYGELANTNQIPFTPYFGSVDATPLFLLLLAEYYHWTEDILLVEQLMPQLEKALNWIDTYGDEDKDSFVEYNLKSSKGIANQGWKDSADSIVHEDGSYAKAPIALVEVQGYVYQAKTKLAPILRLLNKTDLAAKLELEAAQLKESFEAAFWMEDHNKKETPSTSSAPTASAGTESAAPEATKAPAEPTTVTLNGWGASPEETKLLQGVIDEFQKKNPDIKVKYEVIADQYMDVIKTRLIGGTGPDVFYLDAFEAPALIAKNVIEPLDSYVTPEFDVADFEQPLLEAFKVDGKTYGFPKDYSTLALFYNKKMFADAGITAPPATWDEMLDISKKLTKGKTVYGFGAAPELARQMFMLNAFGGKIADQDGNATFGSPEGLKGLQMVIDQHLKDKSSAQPSDVGAGWGGEMFGQGKAAMVLEGNWAIPYLKTTFPDIDYATAEVPTINGKKGTMAFTVAYVMNKDSKNKEASWRLISYLTGKEGMKAWTGTGVSLPTRTSVAAELGFDKDAIRGALVAGGSYALPWQAGITLPTIATNFNNQFVSAYLGSQTLDAAMKKAQDTANKEIKAAQ
ncbi:unnamed protein product [Aphanomyces euteiches]